jgi:hypothetical protein
MLIDADNAGRDRTGVADEIVALRQRLSAPWRWTTESRRVEGNVAQPGSPIQQFRSLRKNATDSRSSSNEDLPWERRWIHWSLRTAFHAWPRIREAYMDSGKRRSHSFIATSL